MSPIEIRLAPLNQWRLALILILAPALLYLILGIIPTVIWIVWPVAFVGFLVRLVRGQSKDPIIVLNDEGVFDSRLKIGVIEWKDIRRLQSYSLAGAEYISLELHDAGKYTARRPAWLGAASQAQRSMGMSSIAISTNGLEVNHETLWRLLHEGCGTQGVEAHTVDMG